MFLKDAGPWLGRRGPSGIQCRFWPCLASLVLVVVLLQLLHLVMLSRLERSDDDSASVSNPLLFPRAAGGSHGIVASAGVGRQLQGRTLATVLKEMQERVLTAYRLDKSGIYHLLDHFLPSELAPRGRAPFDVSLVTQCSTSNLGDIWDLAPRWAGPLSVAVFTYDDDFVDAVSRLLHLHFCNQHVFRNVNFHMVYPISRAPRSDHLAAMSEIKLDCSALSRGGKSKSVFFESPMSANYADMGKELAYPNNLLRNMAINYAQTPYVFVIDVDMLPSEGLRAEFQKFMASRSTLSSTSEFTRNPSMSNVSDISRGTRALDHNSQQKDYLSAFVVPAFELDKSATVPSGKSELLELWQKGLVRPFYDDVCRRCQEATSYDRWRRLSHIPSDSGRDFVQTAKDIRVGYAVNHADPWEPFYIARTSLPLYDERFKQYGFNRISQICEMHIAGFTFHVLDNAFLLHKGFKRPGGFHRDRTEENDRNRLLFRKFKEELKVKYPDVTRRC